MDCAPSWSHHVDYICESPAVDLFSEETEILHRFFCATIQSVLQYRGPVWLCGLSDNHRPLSYRLWAVSLQCHQIHASAEGININTNLFHTHFHQVALHYLQALEELGEYALLSLYLLLIQYSNFPCKRTIKCSFISMCTKKNCRALHLLTVSILAS